MDLKELESGVDPRTHWYYQSKKIPLFKYFEQCHALPDAPERWTIVDFGSGSGFFAYELYEAYPDLIEKVLLVDIGYTQEEMDATAGQVIEKMHYIPEGLSNCMVVMMDVIEHIDDHVGVLEEIKSKVGERSWFFVTVPAFMSVWSSHDVYLGHYRRYTIPTLRGTLDTAGFDTQQVYYLYGALFPAAWAVRRLKRNKENMENPESSDMAPVPGPVNWLLKTYNSLEMKLRKSNKLAGLTCAAEGRIR